MTDMILQGNTRALTMSSREIADLVGSRHDDVKRSIERLASRGYRITANGGNLHGNPPSFCFQLHRR